MMAAYWKSPYKEISHFNNRGPNTSTRRFEQSLSLTRAKTSILTSRQDLFEWNLPSPKRPGSSQQISKTTNNNLKGILKSSRGRQSPRLRIASEEKTQVENGSDKNSSPQRPKRVSFGPCDDAIDDESEYSVSNSRGFRAHYVTLQRLNHSRKVEESAMQKLNKLISGVSMKTPSNQTLSSISSTNTSKLPVVDGKGLLTPRSEPERALSACKHSPDLKCSWCASKDVETGELEVNSPTLESQPLEVCGDSIAVFGVQSEPDSINEQIQASDLDSQSETVKVTLPLTSIDDMSSRLISDKSNMRRRSSPRKSKTMGFQTKRFQSKLLPGRYPFNTGAIHTRNASSRRKNSDSTRPEVGDKPADTASQSLDHTEGDHQGDESAPNSKPGSHQQVPRHNTHSQSPAMSDDTQRPAPVARSKSEVRERRYTDKTAQILTWLKDVRQKQNFKPRSTRFLVVESQPIQ